jgi:hypothetical protein
VLITIEAVDLPGRSCGPGPDYPSGHPNIHVAVQGRKGQQDLLGLTRGDADHVTWTLSCSVVAPPPEPDLRGAQIHGPPGQRFIYLTWGVVSGNDFRMFRRAKLRLDAVPGPVMSAAIEAGGLVGRLGLSDEKGNPLCASVRPPRITWKAA